MVVAHSLKAIVGHTGSMVVVSTAPSMAAVSPVEDLSVVNIPVGNMVAESTVGNLSVANIPVGSMVAENTVGNLRVANIQVGSTVVANIPAGSPIAAIIMNSWAMVSIATERERQQLTFCQEALRRPSAGEPFNLRQSFPRLSVAKSAISGRLLAPDGLYRAPWRSW